VERCVLHSSGAYLCGKMAEKTSISLNVREISYDSKFHPAPADHRARLFGVERLPVTVMAGKSRMIRATKVVVKN
jgi:hypothetical protein